MDNQNNNVPNSKPKIPKHFTVTFVFDKGIQTKIQSNNVPPLEAIGLLEMVKDQLLNNFRQSTENVFNVEKRR